MKLWVRETCRAEELESGLDGVRYLADGGFVVIENTPQASEAWMDLNWYRKGSGHVVPSIHMPRWASRLTLRVVSVRVERVQDITEEDAKAEGVPIYGPRLHVRGRGILEQSHIPHFAWAWGDIYEAKGQGWDANPWVWVVEFRKVEN